MTYLALACNNIAQVAGSICRNDTISIADSWEHLTTESQHHFNDIYVEEESFTWKKRSL